MATNKTPSHKRIQRAEDGRDDWKMKAMLRREEVVKLTQEIKTREDRLSEIMNRYNDLKKDLAAANKKIIKQENQIEDLKKKSK